MESKGYKIRVINHNKTQDHVEYIISFEKDGQVYRFSERYSNLKALNDLLKKEAANNSFPKFPPKKFFGSDDENFLKKRQQELNNYFEAVCANEEFASLSSLKKFLENNIQQIEPINKTNLKQSIGNSNTPNISPVIPQRQSPSDLKKSNEEILKYIKEVRNKFLDLSYYSDPEVNEENEEKYNKLIKDENIMNKDTIKISLLLTNIQPGDDNTFQLIGVNDENFNNIEKLIKEKMDKIYDDVKNMDEIYDTSGLIVPV